MLRKRDISTLLSINSQLCELKCLAHQHRHAQEQHTHISDGPFTVHWQYFLDMAEPLHFSLSMHRQKPHYRRLCRRHCRMTMMMKKMTTTTSSYQMQEGIHHQGNEGHHLTSFTLPYQTQMECYCRRLRQHQSMALGIANFLLSIFQQRCEETKAMATILRQAGAFADGVDARYPNIAKIVAKKQGQCIVTLKDVLLTWSEAVLHSLQRCRMHSLET